RLAAHPQREGAGGAGRADAGPVPERVDGPGPGDQQGGQQARPRIDRGVGLAVAAVAAGERPEPVVRPAVRGGGAAGAGGGGRGGGKVGVVALARKLLIALWRYVDRGERPGGAVEKDWRLLVDSKARERAAAAAAG